MRRAIIPARRQDLEPEELSYTGYPNFRFYRKCLKYNMNREPCLMANTGGYCGYPDNPMVHVCDRFMVDGSHCGRPHPHYLHDQYVALERQRRVEAGDKVDRCWDIDEKLHHGVLETDQGLMMRKGPSREHYAHQTKCETHLMKYFAAKEGALATVTYKGTRDEIFVKYLHDKENGRAWTEAFINCASPDCDPAEELAARLQDRGERVYPGGREFIPGSEHRKTTHDPEVGTLPGGFSPYNSAELENALVLQQKERVS